MKRAASFVLVIGVATSPCAWQLSPSQAMLSWVSPERQQRAYYVGIGGTAHYLDGLVYNRAGPGNNCTDIAVTAVAKNSSDVALTALVSPLPVHVLNAGSSQLFHLQVYPPTGTDHWDMSVTGASTTATYLGSYPGVGPYDGRGRAAHLHCQLPDRLRLDLEPHRRGQGEREHGREPDVPARRSSSTA